MRLSVVAFSTFAFAIFCEVAPRIRAAENAVATGDPIVMLPPFIVEERPVGLEWHYYAAPGFEVLVTGDLGVAGNVVRRLAYVDQIMPFLLPAEFRFAARPESLIVIDDGFDHREATQALTDIMKRREFGFSSNLLLSDSDMSATFAVASSSAGDVERLTYRPERIRELLEQRAPPLPDWFVEGFVDFYRDVRISSHGRRTIVWPLDVSPGSARMYAEKDPKLMPLAEFFAYRKDGRTLDAKIDAEWRAQATLFIRWAISENEGRYRNSLWTFLERLQSEPVSEALFRECFQRGYASVRSSMTNFVRDIRHQVADVEIPDAAAGLPQPPEFRPATPLEVSRLLGNWQRLEMAYVRQHSPEVADKYEAQARKTLVRAYNRGEKDPRLLAAMGLTEVDTGHPAEARPMLEAAVSGKVDRPRVYFELARLRYAEIVRTAGAQAKMNSTQVVEVLGPLSEGQRQNPPLLENYLLFAEVMGRSESPPSSAQLGALRAGALQFPQASDLVARAIYFHLASAQPAVAAELAEVGIRYARDPDMRTKFERAKDAFREATKPANK